MFLASCSSYKDFDSEGRWLLKSGLPMEHRRRGRDGSDAMRQNGNGRRRWRGARERRMSREGESAASATVPGGQI